MTTYPKPAVSRAPAAIADHGRQVTRAHARLDNVESVQSKATSDISTNAANTATNTTHIATNTTAITTANTNIATQATSLTALDSRLGGSAQETFLGSLNQAAVPGSASHTGIGTISGTPTAAEYNATNDDVNNIADLLNALIGRLQASNILT